MTAAQQPAIDWHARARALRPRTGIFIDGSFRPAAAGQSFDCISPIDGRVIAQVAAGDAPDVDAAVASGRAAFERGVWSRQAPKERKRVLLRFAESIRTHREAQVPNAERDAAALSWARRIIIEDFLKEIE